MRWVTAFCAVGILALHVWLTVTGAPRFRDQHLGAAINYAEHGIDLLHPVISGFNANHAPTPQEFPLWQAFAALLLRAGHGAWAWANVASWILFVSCLYPLFQLARHALGERAAWWSLIAFLLQPLIVLHAGLAGTDGAALAAAVWFLFFAEKMIASGAWTHALAAAAGGALAATLKLPFFMAAGIAALGLRWRRAEGGSRTWLQLVLAGALAAAVFLMWSAHCEREFARAEFPLVDLRVNADTGMRDWYFGTWADRMNPTFLMRGAYRVLVGTLGSFALIVVAIAALFQHGQALARWWLGGAAVVTLVFTHLVLEHWHYYLMICPAIALLIGRAVVAAEHLFKARQKTAANCVSLGAIAVLALSSLQGLRTSHFLLRDEYPRALSDEISRHTTPSERLLIAGGGWGGEELLRSRRDGLSIWNTQLLERPETLARLRQLGFTTVVLLSESPQHAAITLLGGSKSQRREWPQLATPIVRSWPARYQTADLCIVALPPAGDATPRP